MTENEDVNAAAQRRRKLPADQGIVAAAAPFVMRRRAVGLGDSVDVVDVVASAGSELGAVS